MGTTYNGVHYFQTHPFADGAVTANNELFMDYPRFDFTYFARVDINTITHKVYQKKINQICQAVESSNKNHQKSSKKSRCHPTFHHDFHDFQRASPLSPLLTGPDNAIEADVTGRHSACVPQNDEEMEGPAPGRRDGAAGEGGIVADDIGKALTGDQLKPGKTRRDIEKKHIEKDEKDTRNYMESI